MDENLHATAIALCDVVTGERVNDARITMVYAVLKATYQKGQEDAS